MRKIIRRKSDNKNVGVVQSEYPSTIKNPLQWELENNVIPNNGGTAEDYIVIDEQTWLDEVKATPEYKKQAIQEELAELDKTFLDARLIEDLIENNPINKEKLDIIARKKVLRQQLKELGV